MRCRAAASRKGEGGAGRELRRAAGSPAGEEGTGGGEDGPRIGRRLRRREEGVLDAANASHPERFSRKAPSAKTPPADAWINQPTTALVADAAARPQALR